MELITALAWLIPLAGMIWTVYRNKSEDSTELLSRIAIAETSIVLLKSDVNRLEGQQEELKTVISDLTNNINQMNLKIERILTILEK